MKKKKAVQMDESQTQTNFAHEIRLECFFSFSTQFARSCVLQVISNDIL